MGCRLSFTIMAASQGVVTLRVQTINNDPMATCTGHFTAGGSIKSRDNRWVGVHNNRRHRTCHLTAGEAIKPIVNRRMGIYNNQRRHIGKGKGSAQVHLRHLTEVQNCEGRR
ncbi:hypothetical protein TNCV_1122331 [Trichonephila clavipes]|nr:hypothetical protein TNCV_1122331 [Trichonephila clavipes]